MGGEDQGLFPVFVLSGIPDLMKPEAHPHVSMPLSMPFSTKRGLESPPWEARSGRWVSWLAESRTVV